MSRIRGNTLAGLLITVALIALLSVVMFKGSGIFGAKVATPRKDGHGTTVMGGAEWAAKDTVCRSNLTQLREALQIAASNNDDKYPMSLSDTKLGPDFYKCPVGGEAYIYDPTTGKVTCPHPGHENY